MKTMVLIALFLGFSAHAQECRLKTPVPFQLGEFGYTTYKAGRIDKMPRADVHNKHKYINGALEIRVSKVWIGQTETPYFSLNVSDGHSLGFGLAQVYNGVQLEGSVRHSGGEQIHEFIEHGYSNTKTIARLTVNAQNQITAAELEIPWKVETKPDSGSYKYMGESDKVCVLELGN